ncbi:MAG: hypothetical protein JWO66_873 [Candidatus Eremiobacteraeota bacterium]|jgi:ATP-dependent Zn protease|nr:hypothetical protein [Candidatus Eremiobacteraeota bacterium]
MYGTGSPYANRPGLPLGRMLRPILIVLGIFILVVFIVDKLVVQPPDKTSALPSVIAHLERRDVRHVTIPARTITVELNDGKRLSAEVPADRDLWPAIRRSGTDVTIARDARSDAAPIGYVFQFVPFIIMALLLVFVLRTARNRAR